MPHRNGCQATGRTERGRVGPDYRGAILHHSQFLETTSMYQIIVQEGIGRMKAGSLYRGQGLSQSSQYVGQTSMPLMAAPAIGRTPCGFHSPAGGRLSVVLPYTATVSTVCRVIQAPVRWVCGGQRAHVALSGALSVFQAYPHRFTVSLVAWRPAVSRSMSSLCAWPIRAQAWWH